MEQTTCALIELTPAVLPGLNIVLLVVILFYKLYKRLTEIFQSYRNFKIRAHDNCKCEVCHISGELGL